MHIETSTDIAAPRSMRFHLVRQGRTGIEVLHADGTVYCFMPNPSRTGLVDCLRANELPGQDDTRDAARYFAETHAHEAGLIFCPRAAA